MQERFRLLEKAAAAAALEEDGWLGEDVLDPADEKRDGTEGDSEWGELTEKERRLLEAVNGPRNH